MTVAVPPIAGAVSVEDVVYLSHASGPLLARLYRPSGTGPFPAVVSVHGGRWTAEDRLTNAVIDERLARAGVVVMAVDFRLPPVSRYPGPVSDINFAIRWLKLHAAELGVSSERIGGMGTSSGGHQLMLNALLPKDLRYSALPLADGAGVDASLDFAVICWAVLDPAGRYVMAKQRGMEQHVAAHDAYWPDMDAMSEGSPQRIVDQRAFTHLPKLLLIQGTGDEILPADNSARFAASYAGAGGEVELLTYDSEPHTFITKRPEAPASQQALDDIAGYVLRQAGPDASRG